MNELSWMIYAAEVSGRLSSLFSFVAGAGLIFGGAASIAYLAEFKEVPKLSKVFLPIFGCMAIVAALLPSPSTIYAIAASEIGEEVLKSPTANKAMKALDTWLDKQIKEEENDETKD